MFRRSPSQNNNNQYRHALASFKELCTYKKSNFLKISIARLNNIRSSKDFWNLARNLNHNKVTKGIGANLNDLEVHFKSITNEVSGSTFNISYAEPEIINEQLDMPFTITELDYVMYKSKDKKSGWKK